MNWFYWWFTNLWYRVFYSDKIFTLVLINNLFERGEMIKTSGKYFLNIIKVPEVKNSKMIRENINYEYTVIPQKYFITKQELFEVLVLLLFLTAIFVFIWITFVV